MSRDQSTEHDAVRGKIAQISSN